MYFYYKDIYSNLVPKSLIHTSFRFRMRHLIILLLFVFLQHTAVAQAPQGFPYQAVARNSSGSILATTSIAIRFSIRDSIAGGSIVYRETHNVTTSPQGLFSVLVGQGSPVVGTFSSVNWGGECKISSGRVGPCRWKFVHRYGHAATDECTLRTLCRQYRISGTVDSIGHSHI